MARVRPFSISATSSRSPMRWFMLRLPAMPPVNNFETASGPRRAPPRHRANRQSREAGTGVMRMLSSDDHALNEVTTT